MRALLLLVPQRQPVLLVPLGQALLLHIRLPQRLDRLLAVLAVGLLAVKSGRPSVVTLVGKLAALLAASAAAISAASRGLRLAVVLALLRVLRWGLRQLRLQLPQLRLPQEPGQALPLVQLEVQPQEQPQALERAQQVAPLRVLLLAQRLVLLSLASELQLVPV
ncbi:hypothetical protein [Desulfovibrio sp.]|uniref:hypothetical protein n=1 Tax=Desulfovibrio sp. TaxID=885 RepID=UPI0025C4CD25|nr:hypothetical protein [Desulfovibrio sp.]